MLGGDGLIMGLVIQTQALSLGEAALTGLNLVGIFIGDNCRGNVSIRFPS